MCLYALEATKFFWQNLYRELRFMSKIAEILKIMQYGQGQQFINIYATYQYIKVNTLHVFHKVYQHINKMYY